MRKSVVVACVVLVSLAVATGVASALVDAGHSGWTWGNPQPQGHTLRQVEFAGAAGYAVGDFGTLLRTGDAGASWHGLRSGTTGQLSELRVLDASSFVAGGGCTLLRSDDAGQTLRSLRFTATNTCSAPLVSFSFASSDIGYLLRSDRTVLRTTDGGQTFTAAASLPSGAPGPPNDIWFTSGTNGVAVTGADVAGQILHTSDGGAHWDNVQSTRAVKSVYFVSALTGYAVGDGVVWKTIDGGATWTAQPDPGAILVSVRCFDEMHCVMVTSNGIVLYTSDGFATLQHSTRTSGTPDPESTVPALAASFSSVTRAVAVGQEGDTWTSDTDGATFDHAYISPLTDLRRLRATSNVVAHAPGVNGKLARTVNAGLSWEQVGVPTTNALVDVSFPSAATGWTVDEAGALFRTDNGGESWAILGQPLPPNTEGLYHLPGDPAMFAVGPAGLLRSTDGGVTFAKVAGKPGSRAYIGIEGGGGKLVAAFGPKTIALTTNGKGWKLLKRPKRMGFVAGVDPVSAGTLYVLDVNGRLWRTANAGKEWRELSAIGTGGAYAVSFGSAKSGWLAVSGFAGTGGGLGWVLHTSDGGASWRPQLIDNRPVRDVVNPKDGRGFALTDGNHLFHTSVGGDAGSPSKLTLTAKGLQSHRVRASGKLSPAVLGGARVAVLWRIGKEQKWHRKLLKTDSSGKFGVTVTDRKSDPRIVFVAQWTGNQQLRSAGSKAAVAKPKKPRKVHAPPGPLATPKRQVAR